MVRHETHHLRPHVESIDGEDLEPVEEGERRRDTGFLVVHRAEPAVDDGGGGGLAEIVTDRPQHQGDLRRSGEIVDEPARLVDHQQRMHPHVPFGMPLRLLWAADKGAQLGKQPFDDAQLPGEREPDRGAGRLEQEFFQLAPDALGRQIVERDLPAERLGRLLESEVQAGRELNGPQNSQTVVAEGRRIGRPKQAPSEILQAPVGIEVLAGQRIPRDGVDREVAAPRRLRERQPRVAGHLEAAVARRDFRFAPRQRHIDRAELVDREAFADGVDRTEPLEQRLEAVGGQAVHLEVEVFRLAAEQAVPHPTADDEGAPAGLAHGAGDADGEIELVRHGTRSLP